LSVAHGPVEPSRERYRGGPSVRFLHGPSGVLTPRIILFALALAQLADALTFTIGVSRYGIGLESNGIAAMLFRFGGLEAVLIVKGLALVATIGLLVATVSRFPRLFVWGSAAATAFGLLGFATNAISLSLLA
jgi:hypothetical protein